jgi:hypothetical protein
MGITVSVETCGKFPWSGKRLSAPVSDGVRPGYPLRDFKDVSSAGNL